MSKILEKQYFGKLKVFVWRWRCKNSLESPPAPDYLLTFKSISRAALPLKCSNSGVDSPKKFEAIAALWRNGQISNSNFEQTTFWRYQALIMSRRTFSNLTFGASWTLAFPYTAENSIRPPLEQHIQMLANWSGEEEKEWSLFWSIYWVIKRGGALRGAVIPLEYYMNPIAAILPKIAPVIRNSWFRIIGPLILKTGFWNLNPPLISYRSNCWRLKSTIAWPK